MQAGEVWWVQFDVRQLVVLVAVGEEPEMRGIQVVAPSGVDLTGLGVEIEVGAAEGLAVDGVVRIGFPRPGYHPCTWLTVLRRDDLMERAGRVSSAKLTEISQALSDAEQMREWSPQDRARFDQLRDAAVRFAKQE